MWFRNRRFNLEGGKGASQDDGERKFLDGYRAAGTDGKMKDYRKDPSKREMDSFPDI